MGKKSLILYPILFAAFPVLNLFAVNKDELSLGDESFLITLAAVLAITVVLWILLSWILRSRGKAAIIVSLFVVLFFSYGHVHSFIDEFIDFEVFGIEIGPDKFLLSIWGLALLGGFLLVLRGRRDWKALNGFLNVIGAFLIIASLVDIIPYEIQEAGIVTPAESSVSESTTEPNAIKASELPDIYYLIFDRYANETTLKEYLNFDNSEFISFLKEKGFYVASKSLANYARTHLSLPSSLNMEHMTTLTASFDKEWSTKKPLNTLMEDTQVMQFLKKKGYKYIHFGGEYAPIFKNRFADLNIIYSADAGGGFKTILLKTTPYYPIVRKFTKSDPPREKKRKIILYKFERLSEMPEIEGPTFVFAHFVLPHPPCVFDQDGKPVNRSEDTELNSTKNYLNQLVFTNKKIKETVTQILAKSEKTPIIVIQSDEGPPFGAVKYGGAFGPNAYRKAHFPILNAYLLPGVKNSGLYQSITPVNSFRLIFNNYFGTNYKLLPDESYTTPGDDRPYMYTNVTEEVRLD